MFADEFQNFVGDLNDLEAVLSESRKMRLALTIAHQNMAQLNTELRSSILGNVGTKILFRLSHRDASYLSSELNQREKILIERRLVDLKVGEAYLKKKGENPIIIKTSHVPELQVDNHTVDLIKNASFARYARSKAEIEKEIQQRTEEISCIDPRSTETDELSAPLAPRTDFEEGLDEW